jgi:hypothetical protein
MSFTTGTQSEVIFSGPPANYTAANASSSSAQSLIAGATGNYQQPVFLGGFWQQGRTGQCARVTFAGNLAGQGSATTAIFTAGLNTAANTIGGSTLAATNAQTVTSFASGAFFGEFLIQNRGSGYGTSSVSTNLLTSGYAMVQNGSTTGGTNALAVPTALQTIDFSVNQWLYLTVTFSTSSSSNSATLTSLVVYGEN